MANFEDSMKLLEPQLNALIVASANIQRSEKLKELLEIILCFGNYMNAGRRGPAYGFKVKVHICLWKLIIYRFTMTGRYLPLN